MQLIAKTSELLLVLLADFVVLRFQLEELLVEESIFVHLRSNLGFVFVSLATDGSHIGGQDIELLSDSVERVIEPIVTVLGAAALLGWP